MKHNWTIYNLKRTISDGVVTEVTYGCESEDGSAYTRHIGSFTITGSTEDEGFIAYDSLQSSDVIGWLDSNVDKSSIESSNSGSIADALTRQAARTTVSGLPWE